MEECNFFGFFPVHISISESLFYIHLIALLCIETIFFCSKLKMMPASIRHMWYLPKEKNPVLQRLQLLNHQLHA